ncbi:MAG: biotin/lipoyl-containing protein [Pseudomonadota bacterium]
MNADDLEAVRAIIQLAKEHELAELEVRAGELTVRAVRSHAAAVTVTPGPQNSGSGMAADIPDGATESSLSGGTVIAAPIAGTFYVAAAPGAEPFAPVGATIEAGTVICIIESMKMMNEIRADQSGSIAAVLVPDGTAIESGTPLFRLR